MSTGEAVFNTVLSGYQEVITDPSYAGQVIAFTYPHIGNYGVNPTDDEAPRPHCSGVIVRDLADAPSSFRSEGTLEDFLVGHGVSGITGIDTRRLTRHLRDHGSVPCAFGTATEADLRGRGPRRPSRPTGATWCRRSRRRRTLTRGSGPYRVVAYDFGIKEAMLRQLGDLATVTVVPASTPADAVLDLGPDGIFLSNGPGDPAALPGIIGEVRRLVDHGAVPIFGICLGHQLLASALGATTYKLPFGHHGGNHPVQRTATGRVEITSQNHNYAVAADSLGVDRGHPRQPQRRGDRGAAQHRDPGLQRAVPPRGRPRPPRRPLPVRGVPDADGRPRPARRPGRPGRGRLMPRRDDLESILVIGSGPIVIGQACEFDYSGTQACRVLAEEGYRVVLANSNPATIMTDPGMADRTYVEPLDPDVLTAIIERERPDALLPTLGGQTALNLTMALSERGVLEANGVEVIGANPEAIATAEDRERFKEAMEEIGLSTPASGFAHSLDEAMAIGATIGYPIMVRPSYILGGAGTGIARDAEALVRLAAEGLDASPVTEVLIERSIAGQKEFELEVMRDHADNCVVICSIENFDPMGVHTGDSITVAPAQTLTDVEYQAMRDDAFALHPPGRRGDGRLERPVRRRPQDRPPDGHRDEPPGVPVVGARLQGHRVPDRQDRRPPGRRLPPRRDPQRHHRGHPGQLRADHRLRGHQDPAVGVREAARGHRRARHPDAVGGGGHGHRSDVPRVAAEGDPLARAGPLRPQRRPGGGRRGRELGRAPARRGGRRPRPSASSSSSRCCAGACPSTSWPTSPASTRGSCPSWPRSPTPAWPSTSR